MTSLGFALSVTYYRLYLTPPPWAILQDSKAELWRSAPWWRWIFTELQQPGGVDHTSGSAGIKVVSILTRECVMLILKISRVQVRYKSTQK